MLQEGSARSLWLEQRFHPAHMFRHRSQLRRWAAQVLVLLLFGIGAGFANACLVTSTAEPGAVESGRAVASYPSDLVAAVASDDAHRVSPGVAHHGVAGHDQAPGKTNCQDFCDKSTITVPQLKSALDHANADALPASAVTLRYAVAAAEPVQCGVLRRDGDSAPPITIAFLRLAL